MHNLINSALNIISQNPEIANNPVNRARVETLKRGDVNEINKLANDICNTYGVDFNDTAQQAARVFHLWQ